VSTFVRLPKVPIGASRLPAEINDLWTDILDRWMDHRKTDVGSPDEPSSETEARGSGGAVEALDDHRVSRA